MSIAIKGVFCRNWEYFFPFSGQDCAAIGKNAAISTQAGIQDFQIVEFWQQTGCLLHDFSRAGSAGIMNYGTALPAPAGASLAFAPHIDRPDLLHHSPAGAVKEVIEVHRGVHMGNDQLQDFSNFQPAG